MELNLESILVIIWNDNLKTGILSIDEQHQELFETINKLEKCKTSESIFYKVLSDLNRYISVHFVTEEDYMKHTGYPKFKVHKECHEKFSADLKKLFKENSSKSSIMNSRIELIEFVENWLKNHYENEDVEMAAYLNKQSDNN